MQGSKLSILYKLGWLVLKLSIEATLSPSKKNCVVISLPSLLTQVRKQPFSIKNIVLEISPSCKRIVLAGTSCRLKRWLNLSQLLVIVYIFYLWEPRLVSPRKGCCQRTFCLSVIKHYSLAVILFLCFCPQSANAVTTSLSVVAYSV